MAFPFNDLVYTKSFTPREYQVELLYAAKQKNIIICLGKYTEQTFITIKLIQEYVTGNRDLLNTDSKKIVYILDNHELCLLKAQYIEQLTDLKVWVGTLNNETDEFVNKFLNAHVIILTSELFNELLQKKKILGSQINLIIIDQCQLLVANDDLKQALKIVKSNKNNLCRFIGLAVPLFGLTEEPGRLSLEIERFESTFKCHVETTSDILSILRYSSKPKEYVVEYKTGTKGTLHSVLEKVIVDAMNFLDDHRYDPTEIYQDEFLEDIQKIPDPTAKPRELLQDFSIILETLGPWCADRAALSLLVLAEKLKIKTPYERHYLLLNMIASVMIKIRAICDYEFRNIPEKSKILNYSSPKVHRLLEALKTFTSFHDKSNKKCINNSKCVPYQNTNKINPRQFHKTNDKTKISKFSRPHRNITDPDLLCGIVFVDKGFTAKILFYLLYEIAKCDDDLNYLSPLYTTERTHEEKTNCQDPEMEHRKQEEVLKRFRIHECNLLIATAILEEGIEIPKCNFVMRFDFPKSYRSYVQCKSRAKAVDALHVLLVENSTSKECVWKLSQYHYIENILLKKCTNNEPTEAEEIEADLYSNLIPSYQPLQNEIGAIVTFNSAISLINRYCAKLPSDTFTRLTPEWSIAEVTIDNNLKYICSLRLPINSPLKYVIISHPMPNRAMARRLAALQLCIKLHKENEIDDNLLPIGKENFKARPEDAEVPALPDESQSDLSEARPGTTKRRQYYYKKIAEALTDCRPTVGVPAYLYHIKMVLSCPLPEEQNTRGRRIYPPEESDIGFGILTLKKIPKLCPFPIYTRSGEVQVELKLSKNTVVLDSIQIERIYTFLNYTFTNVLRLQKYLMIFDPNASENSYIIIPVKKYLVDGFEDVNVDWNFLDVIYDNRNTIPSDIKEEDRVNFEFDPSRYHDAVIMPWYRNQDQPQYFYVAEICRNLSPKSSFPGDGYSTFEEYYKKKYDIKIQNSEQPLLDVDHTSARLNFLTPRYVNRKGVALPTSSEETKRAKRENLEQKQILVAELCAIHPFPASLWRQAVCLPCILYRINALLLANQIRCQVADAINLGQQYLDSDFEWPALNFGWNLAEVLKKSKEFDKNISKDRGKLVNSRDTTAEVTQNNIKVQDKKKDHVTTSNSIGSWGDFKEVKNDCNSNGELEIGTWSNDMAINSMDIDDEFKQLPNNITVLQPEFSWNDVRCGSPTYESEIGDYYSDDSYSDDGYIESSDESEDENRGLRISYTGDNIAEAVEDESKISKQQINKKIMDLFNNDKNFDNIFLAYSENNDNKLELKKHESQHYEFSKKRESEIITSDLFITSTQQILFDMKKKNQNNIDSIYKPGNLNLNFIEDVRRVGDLIKKDISREKSLNYNKKNLNDIPTPNLYKVNDTSFSFDHQPELRGNPGPSPSLILQALTMSNANDGINLERLETIGDSFLKYAITTYLYCTYDVIHEGKLSHLRSKQVSNLNLYRLGRQKMLGESMIATKFEPHDNWLPPCYYVPRELEQVFIKSGVPSTLWNQADIPLLEAINLNEMSELIKETEYKLDMMRIELDRNETRDTDEFDSLQCSIPYNLITQHSIPDKSIADCVEALIGAYLIACGPRGALLFMEWLGIHVLPTTEVIHTSNHNKPLDKYPGSSQFVKKMNENGQMIWSQTRYGKLEEPRNPLLRHVPDPENELNVMLDGYSCLEESINYKFKDVSYLLQAFTHASYQPNKLTDCYQRLEFLGDAVLDYLITRHLYEDSRQHSPGALTDLRSALVNNTIFASLAVRCGFHKYFRHLSPGLNVVIDQFVRIQEENGHSISEEYYLIGKEDSEEAEDVEVPKALGDVFESLAGAIYLDSGMSLDAVWNVYYRIMKAEIEQFSTNVPKSPIRELLELEPETAKFGKPEKLTDGRRVRVTVDVFGKGSFKGIGRNYRIAKCTAAKCALKKLKKTQSSHRQKI
ncbi:endoribonuclease Dcr-1 isoform X2 [Microplitis mediator]|uniref:endoribonuclease Dcr-1 isoform X2 n=1 Tax=Microplitis mediator TaxID=375433 RepID=UPI00255644E3|nr:endoribonuclease Dcr-1 isoform X2 [Microplitis mediator]